MTGFGEPTIDDSRWLREEYPTIREPLDERCTACWALDGRGKWEFWPCPKHASKGAA
jgi:hypothetical protein